MNIKVKNICGDFLRFWEEAQKVETIEEKKALWDRIYEGPNKDIFDIYYKSFGHRKNLDSAIVERYPKEIERIKKINRIIESKIREVSAKCSELFGTYNIDFNYVVMVGSFSSNGWGCTFNNEPTVFFALEFETDPAYFDIFLAHEITHNFHMNINKNNECDSLADCTLGEGLAVVASKVLYPGLKDTAYLNFGPSGDEWIEKCKHVFKDIRDEYIGNLASNNQELVNGYFLGKIKEEKKVPNRIGYVIGYVLVMELIKEYTFYELASWDSSQTLSQVKKVLNSLL